METLNEVINKTVGTCKAKDEIMCLQIFPSNYNTTHCLWIVNTMYRIFQGDTLEEALEHLTEEGGNIDD